jgi:hypothetical protein
MIPDSPKNESVDIDLLAEEIQNILQELISKGESAKYSIRDFESKLVREKSTSYQDTIAITRAIFNTGLFDWGMISNSFILKGGLNSPKHVPIKETFSTLDIGD